MKILDVILLVFFVLNFIAWIWVLRDVYNMQKELIKRGFAQYNPTTGQLEWTGSLISFEELERRKLEK